MSEGRNAARCRVVKKERKYWTRTPSPLPDYLFMGIPPFSSTTLHGSSGVDESWFVSIENYCIPIQSSFTSRIWLTGAYLYSAFLDILQHKDSQFSGSDVWHVSMLSFMGYISGFMLWEISAWTVTRFSPGIYNATVWKDLERLSGFDLQRSNLQAHHRCFEFSQNISSE